DGRLDRGPDRHVVGPHPFPVRARGAPAAPGRQILPPTAPARLAEWCAPFAHEASRGGPAAVHGEHVPGDVARRVRRQEQHRPVELGDVGDPAQGVRALIRLRWSRSASSPVSGVGKNPGASALTRTPRPPHCSARCRVKVTRPPFAAWYPAIPAPELIMPKIDAMLITAAPGRPNSSGPASRHRSTTATRSRS